MLITHATVANPAWPDQFHENVALHIREGRIAALGPTDVLRHEHPEAEILDARGGLVLPGLVCAHTHFYGAFARGMALPGEPAATFPQILERLWWRLDKLLQPDDIAYSVLVFLCDAIRHGTTTVIDHHASPNAIAGSLDAIAYGCSQAGVRACLCYEMTDRDGPERFRQGLAENQRFGRRVRALDEAERGMLAASVGLHASFTLSDESLQEAAGLARDLDLGCHIHVAEDRSDVEDSLRRSGVRAVGRLARAGVLGPKSIAAHCVHVDDEEMEVLRSTSTWVVHNPRSNMNNAVGTARVPAMLAAGIPVGLGNDGFSMNMFQEMKAAYLVHKQASGDPRTLGADRVVEMQWRNNAALASTLLNVTGLGDVGVGSPADLIILDYQAPTPVTAANLPWHIAFGIDGEHVRTSIVGGRVLMRERQLLTLDEEHIHAKARELAARLWHRL